MVLQLWSVSTRKRWTETGNCTTTVLREVLDHVQTANLHDRDGVRRYAVGLALKIHQRDLTLRKEIEELWQLYHARCLRRWAQKGVRPAGMGRVGFGIAAGS